jgi:hypothetical protein
MDEQTDYQRRRERYMVVFFTAFLVFGLLVTFTILTGGFLIWLLIAVVAIAAVAGGQYLLWTLFSHVFMGRSLSEYIEEERQEMEAREPSEPEEWEADDPRRPRHY